MRRLFVGFILCVILLWSTVLLRFGFHADPQLLPDLFRNADSVQPDKVCAPLATILVNSAPWHASLRQVIRETWGHPTSLRPLGIGLAFGLGSSDEAPVQLEAAACGDLLQYPGAEGYRELSRKVEWMLRELYDACRPLFVLKVDDDVFVNVHALHKLLLELVPQSSEKKVWCLVWEGMPVIRANHSKWFVSRDTYSELLYPTYCSGAAYILSAPAIQAINRQVNTSHKLQPSQDPQIKSTDKTSPSLNQGEASSNSRLISTKLLITSEYSDFEPTAENNANPQVTSRGETSGVITRPRVMSGDEDGPLVTSEDVYITGLLAKKAYVTHVQLGTRYAFESIERDRISDGRTIFAHLGPEAGDKTEELWDWVQKYKKKPEGEEMDKGL